MNSKTNQGEPSSPSAYWTPDATAVIQMRNNFNFLMSAIDQIHDALCPDKIGTWQMRTEQTIAAAKALVSNIAICVKAAGNAGIERPMKPQKEV